MNTTSPRNNNVSEEKAMEIFNEIGPQMGRLKARWNNEKEYENWKDYTNIIKEEITKMNGVFMGMKKRPFLVDFEIKENAEFWRIKIKGTRTHLIPLFPA